MLDLNILKQKEHVAYSTRCPTKAFARMVEKTWCRPALLKKCTICRTQRCHLDADAARIHRHPGTCCSPRALPSATTLSSVQADDHNANHDAAEGMVNAEPTSL